MFRPQHAIRCLVLAASLVSPMASPAFAGPDEAALLARYQGNWRGVGKVVGSDPGTVVCRLTMRAAASGRLSFTGRCSYGGSGAASFRGTMLYNDSARRYEAATSAQGVSTVAVGKKQGGGIVFASGRVDTRYGSTSSALTLGGNAIQLSFKLVGKDGRSSASNVVFQRG